jgi:regulator of sigma E protease
MQYILSIIAFIIIFSIIVLIHEAGHFFMAKKSGVKVLEFGIGLPPRIWGKKKGDTIYSINWIPFGGFVQMLGENGHDKRLLKNNKSFVSKPPRIRAMILCAGVFMNFLLSWVLLTAGFTVGMQPLLLPDDILPALRSENILLEEGVKIKTVEVGSFAEKAGFKVGDVIYSINGEKPTYSVFLEALSSPNKIFNIIRDGNFVVLKIDKKLTGLEYFEPIEFPRIKIKSMDEYGDFYKAGIMSGDYVLQVDGVQVFYTEDFFDAIKAKDSFKVLIYRDGVKKELTVNTQSNRGIIVVDVLADSPAQKAGILKGDVVLAVNGVDFYDGEKLINYIDVNSTKTLAVSVLRGEEKISFNVKPKDGKMGVLMSDMIVSNPNNGYVIYDDGLLSSVIKIQDQKYPIYKSAYVAFAEMWKISKMTSSMFFSFIGKAVTSGSVPAQVSGPIGIAQMTHVFVKEGLVSLVRFLALLSLSLAVINILPFPALDGGRLIFVLFEWIFGRRVSAKFENYIHSAGYVVIIFLVLMVSYSDILRIVKSW